MIAKSGRARLKIFLFAMTLMQAVVAQNIEAVPSIIPLPQVLQTNAGTFTLCPTQTVPVLSPCATKIIVEPQLRHEGEYLAGVLMKSTGFRFEVSTNTNLAAPQTIFLTSTISTTNLGAEGYELTVGANSVTIGGQSAGVFYGIQTFLQLLPPQIFSQTPVSGVPWVAPCVYVLDWPRFSWRGWMIDSARHFLTKDEIKHILDSMTLHKLNTLHWHLDDDSGWRIEIKKWPLLTQVGAWRNGVDFGLNPRTSKAYDDSGRYGGFYTQDDVREIVSYATQRHINIVPEIEMPGHSLAAITAYPQFTCGCATCEFGPYGNLDVVSANASDVFCPARPETMSFLEDILTEVIELFPSQYIHIGGDEVSSYNWSRHKLDVDLGNSLQIGTGGLYQRYFEQRIVDFIASKGRTAIGWSELFSNGPVTNAAVMDWLTGTSSQAINAATNGAKVVMCPQSFAYINYAETSGQLWVAEPPAQSYGSVLALSTVYGFEPVPFGLSANYTNNIIGMQGNTWGEYIASGLDAEFRAYPRMCAIAETDWTSASLKSYSNFTNRLTFHKQRLDTAGVGYNPSAKPAGIATWSSAQIPTSYSTVDWDITGSITPGDFVTSFIATNGAAMSVAWVGVLENGQQIDLETNNYAPPYYSGGPPPTYILRVPGVRRGASYTLRALVKASSASNGIIYHPTKWN